MKKILTFLLVLCVCLANYSYAYTQTSKRITVKSKNIVLAEFFKKIKEQTGLTVFYSNKLIDDQQKVDVNFQSEEIDKVFNKILAEKNLSHSIKDNYIIIQQKQIGPETAKSSLDFKVTGRVVDESGQPMVGITIKVKGTKISTTTNQDGFYQIEVPNSTSILTFSYVSFLTQELAVGSQSKIDVILKEELRNLDEIVIVGYGTQRKQDVTGSISTIKAEDIRTQGSNSVQKALQGKVAGVQVESAGGNPGSGVRILIRGTGSLNNNNPLYIVDGIQVDNINNLNPSDIASIDILKDASAAAIYGSRASNGVVLVTTKSGKSGPTKIDFETYFGLQKIAKTLDVLNAQEWAEVSNAAYNGAGLTPLDIAKNVNTLGVNTDWQKELYQIAPMQSYNLGASGGGENYSFSMSGSHINQDGVVKNTNYNRWNFRVKSDFTKGRLKIGESIILSKEYFRTMAGGWGGQGGNPVGSAVKMIPVFNIYDETAIGGYAGAYGPVANVANPIAQLNLEIPENRSTNILLNAYAEVRILDDLKYKFNLGYTNTFGYNYNYVYPYVVGTLFTNVDSDLSESRSQTDYFLQEHTLNYQKTIGKSRIEALTGITYQNSKYRILNGSKSGMPEGIKVIDAGISNTAAGSNASENTLLSYLGRAIYSFDDRYVLTATIRRDGSSRFGNNNRYGNFPSFAAAWNISNESFFKLLIPTVSSLKLRGSYGVLGNQEISDYRYIPSITSNANYVIGQNQQLMPGAIQVAFETADIKWENSKTFNFGADVSVLSNKVSLTVDYFNRQNTDILLQVPIPLSTGASTNPPYVNAGQITNKGLEAALSYAQTDKPFSYQLSASFTAVKNEVDFLGTGTQQIFGGAPTHAGASATVTQAGLPVGAFYLIKPAGIFNSQEEINAYAKNGQLIQPSTKPGDIRFEDYNGDGKIDQSDRQNLGSANPKFSYGFGGNASYKNFDISVFFQGTYGNKIYNGLRQDLEGMNININYAKSTLNAWTPTNHTEFPRAVINDPNLNSQTSSRFLEDGSYLRFKTLQVGYTLPKQALDAIKVSSLRLYVSIDNLYTITGYKGYNPDLGRTGSVLDRGVDFGHVAYPLARTALFGLQLSL